MKHLYAKNGAAILISMAVLSLTPFEKSVLAQTSEKGSSGESDFQNTAKRIAEDGHGALIAHNYTVAEQDYTRLLKLGVRSASVYSDLGVVYLRTGRTNEAIKSFLEAKTLSPNEPGIHLNLGLAYFRKHEFKTAANYFGDVVTTNSGSVQARYLSGVCHFMLDDFQGAVAAFEPLETQEQNDLEFLFMLGTSYGMLRRNDDSLRVFERMIEAGGDTPHLHLLLGKSYLALGQNDKAAAELKRASEGETVPFAHYYFGELYRQEGESKLAIAEFQQEIASNPSNRFAYKDLAKALLEDRDDSKAAIAVLEKGVKNSPDAPELFALLGRAYLKASSTQRAIAILKKAVALAPQSSTYHYQLARAYLRAGRETDANTEITRARQLIADTPEGKMQSLSREQDSVIVNK